MKGIEVVLYAAVLLCAISSTFAADCGGNGELTGHSSCVCVSGYSGASCGTFADNRCVGRNLTFTEANHFPSLDVVTNKATRFEGNYLYAKIQGEYVKDRQYKELKFTPGDDGEKPACALGGVSSYWTQTSGFITGDLCNDTFALALPWSNHRDCGFKNNTKLSQQDPENLYITGYFHISYVDLLGEVDNFTLTRSTSVPYSITVKFQRFVTVQLKALNVSSDVKYGMALTEDVYDPDSKLLTLELTTIVNWPNMFYHGSTAMKFYHPDQALVQKVDDNGNVCANQAACTYPIYPQDIECSTTVEGTPCKQTFTFKAMVDTTHPVRNCTFDGQYDLEISLYTCRATGSTDPPSCTNQKLNITFTISESDVCGSIQASPAVSGDLVSFPPTVTDFRNNWSQKTTFFKLGTYANFYADIKSDDNDISIHFTNVKFQVQNTGNNWRNLFSTTESTSDIPTGIISVQDQLKYFKIYFHSSIFKVDPNSRIVYTFSATAEVSFRGNANFDEQGWQAKKRTIEYTWTQGTADAETNVFLAGESMAAQQVGQSNAGVDSVTFIASVVGAVAGTMIIVFVVVGFVLRSRRNEESSSTSVLAASAAASEVANRA